MLAFRPLLDSGSGSAPGATCWHSDRYYIVAVGQPQVPHVGIQIAMLWFVCNVGDPHILLFNPDLQRL